MRKKTAIAPRNIMLTKLDAINERIASIKLIAETIYKTNGEIKWGKVVYTDLNIHRSNDINVLLSLLGFITTEFKAYENAAEILHLDKYPAFVWMGFPYEHWKHDISIRISQLKAEEQIQKLNRAKRVLEGFMSDDDRLKAALKELESEGI